MGSRVQPSVAATQNLDVEFTPLKVGAVNASDLEFATRGGFHRFGDGDDFLIVEVEPGNGEFGFGIGGLFFHRDGLAIGIELHDPKAMGVVDLIAEHRRSRRAGSRLSEFG